MAKLPEQAEGRGFTRQRLNGGKGAGVEIVLELDGVDELEALHDRCQRRAVVSESLELQPWGLYDFRVTDPDGYYLRITHGNAAAQFVKAGPGGPGRPAWSAAPCVVYVS